MEHNIKDLVKQMTLEEKAGLCSGFDFWHTKPVERLGIPSVMVSDGPCGLRKQDDKADHLGVNESIKAVCYPSGCLTACSFDPELLEKEGATIGDECLAENVAVILGPALNIKRSPLCGRNFEYFSEDPYLAGVISASFVKGVQSKNVGTSIKHFAVNSQEYRRMSCSSNVDERTIREIYFPAFEKTVKEGKPDTVMCSYNRINGVFASENKWLLTDVLRKGWGFDGYVVSDWGAVNKRVEGLVAGLDLEMPDSGGTTDRQIVEAVKSGKLKQSVLDKTVERILRIVFKFVDGKTEGNFDKEAHHKLVAEIAKESMVLLKNEKNILPLKEKDAESILFVGEFAKTPRYEGGGSAHINTWKVTSALDAAKACGLKVNYVQGYDVKEKKDKKLLPEAIEASKKAKTVVIFAGLPDSYESEGYDRKDMKMPQNQDVLISEIAKVNKNVVVVLHNGSPVEMPWVNDVKGILESYLAGESVGTAQIDLLFGKANPCGKLAETFPVKTSDNPTFLNFPGNGHDVNYAEGIYIGYRYYDKKEIVQLYVSELTGTHEDRPVKELKAFTKVQLNPKESKVVTMTLDKRSFAFWNTEIGDWYAPTGEYLISAGASCTDIRLKAKVNVTSTAKGVFKINENTVLEEMLEHPVAAKCAEPLVKSFMDEMLGDRSESEKDSVSDEMMLAMLRSMPLRALRSFINMKDEEVVKFIEETNKELSK